jgi:hypothetical protein
MKPTWIDKPRSDRIVKFGEILTTENLLCDPSGGPRIMTDAIALAWLVLWPSDLRREREYTTGGPRNNDWGAPSCPRSREKRSAL